jgi:hypothetical protein
VWVALLLRRRGGLRVVLRRLVLRRELIVGVVHGTEGYRVGVCDGFTGVRDSIVVVRLCRHDDGDDGEEGSWDGTNEREHKW